MPPGSAREARGIGLPLGYAHTDDDEGIPVLHGATCSPSFDGTFVSPYSLIDKSYQ
jgi:hypothetical protein